MTNEEPIYIDRAYLLGERQALLLRLKNLEDWLKIPRSVVPKSLRKPWKMFLEAYKEVRLNDYPEDDLNDLEVDKI